MSEKLSDFICWVSFLLLAASLASFLLRRERSDARSKNPIPLRVGTLQQKAHRLSLYLQGRWQAILRRDVL
jgi:hypothetical protein